MSHDAQGSPPLPIHTHQLEPNANREAETTICKKQVKLFENGAYHLYILQFLLLFLGNHEINQHLITKQHLPKSQFQTIYSASTLHSTVQFQLSCLFCNMFYIDLWTLGYILFPHNPALKELLTIFIILLKNILHIKTIALNFCHKHFINCLLYFSKRQNKKLRKILNSETSLMAK